MQSMSSNQFRHEFTPLSRDSSPSPQLPELIDWLLGRRFGMTSNNVLCNIAFLGSTVSNGANSRLWGESLVFILSSPGR